MLLNAGTRRGNVAWQIQLHCVQVVPLIRSVVVVMQKRQEGKSEDARLSLCQLSAVRKRLQQLLVEPEAEPEQPHNT